MMQLTNCPNCNISFELKDSGTFYSQKYCKDCSIYLTISYVEGGTYLFYKNYNCYVHLSKSRTTVYNSKDEFVARHNSIPKDLDLKSVLNFINIMNTFQ